MRLDCRARRPPPRCLSGGSPARRMLLAPLLSFLLLFSSAAAVAQTDPVPVAAPVDTIRLRSGVIFWTTRPGVGERPNAGQKVWIQYTGRLADGKIFDTSRKTGKPFKFTLGAGQVIPGMDETIAQMHVGQQLTVIIPAELGYGATGQTEDADDLGTVYRIPPNADLTFDLELVKFSK